MDETSIRQWHPRMRAKTTRYDHDFCAWSREQADLLRAGNLVEADLENIAGKNESMGKTEKRELIHRPTVLILHLVKWRFQPAKRSRSCRSSVEGQRLDIEDLLKDNPSLRPVVSDSIEQAWRRALIEAQKETGLDASMFPRYALGPRTASSAMIFGLSSGNASWPHIAIRLDVPCPAFASSARKLQRPGGAI